jgi:hypothetical protein
VESRRGAKTQRYGTLRLCDLSEAGASLGHWFRLMPGWVSGRAGAGLTLVNEEATKGEVAMSSDFMAGFGFSDRMQTD